MKLLLSFVTVLVNSALFSLAVTPMDTPLKEGGEILIECECTLDEPAIKKKYDLEVTKGTYHYKLFVPEGYSENPELKYPCLFVQSPSGNAGLGNIADFAAENKWVVVMLVESKNGSGGICNGNFVAAHDDVIKRVRILDEYKVATGLSGGARCASVSCGMRDGFAGVILQGAGCLYYTEGNKRGRYFLQSFKNKSILLYGIFGENDSNKSEIDRLKKVMPKSTLNKFVLFDGGHTWAPAEYMSDALKWIEENQLKSGKNRGMVKSIVMHKIGTQDKGQTKLEQYEKCIDSLMLIKTNRLTTDADARKLTTELLAQKKKIESDADMKKELLAYKDFKKARAEEDKFRHDSSTRKMSGMYLKAKISKCIKYYKMVDSKHPDTESSVRSQDRISALEGELAAL